MKKCLFLIAAMFVAVAATHAQTPTATLSHEGTVKCFYGSQAFVNALNAAIDGDEITLSSGTFQGYNATSNTHSYLKINKAVNIKGAGMVSDTINKIEKTIIISGGDNQTYIQKNNVTINGIYFTGDLTLDSTNIKINKCTIMGTLQPGSGYSYNTLNNYVYNCRCNALNVGYYSVINVVNSYIYNAYNYSSNGSQLFVTNSIVGYCGGNTYRIYNSTFYNSIIFENNLYSKCEELPSSNYVYYCVGKNPDGSIFDNVLGYDDGSGNYVSNNTNTVISDLSTIFKTFNGENYNEYETFELTTAAQSAYLGNDNTQVGMYGGSLPYNPFLSHPIITKLTVAEKSTPQGTLSVDIEVKPAQ